MLYTGLCVSDDYVIIAGLEIFKKHLSGKSDAAGAAFLSLRDLADRHQMKALFS